MSVLLNSCITFIDKELDIKPKLVLYCYLVPQLDTTILSLTNSAPLFTKNPYKIEVVKNATVEISNDNMNWVEMEFDSVYKHYYILQEQFPIVEGKTYYVRAAATGFESVSASCIVPFFRETYLEMVFDESINDFHHGEFYNWQHFHGYLEWMDYLGEENYYIFYDKKTLFWSTGWDIYGNPTTDTSFHYGCWPLSDIDYNPCIYSDFDHDGKKFSVFMLDYMPETFEMTLLQVDRNCYLFEKCLIDYENELQFFLLEPTQFYSNVKNGYGLFGAFAMKNCVLWAKK